MCIAVSPCFNEGFAATANSTDPECCPAGGDPFSSKPGCERWQFVVGMDEAMLSSDMGLYRNFTTENGFPGGCDGLEYFNLSVIESGGNRFRVPRIPASDKNGEKWDSSYCPLNTIADPEGTPMYQIVDEYADSAAAFLADFFPALEKMQKNGYTDAELTSTELSASTCPLQDTSDSNRFYTCTPPSPPSSPPPPPSAPSPPYSPPSPPASPPPPPPPPPPPCATFCTKEDGWASSIAWTRKCNWRNCAGCSEC